ncbi:MAG TPA: hypothetical protein VK779_11610 [Rhizomicrobium sp.]|jgi:hypothetical protein|nr:hypothetical protein [Rhizomicrobium sp.]
MLSGARLGIIMVLLGLALPAVSQAQSFDQYCNLPGFPQPLRQTIIVLDESQIYPEAGSRPDQRNMSWRRFLGNLILSDQTALEQIFSPREHIAVVIARRDGAGTRLAFSACLPFYSEDEKKKIAQSAGNMQSMNTFFGTGPIADAKKDMDLFRIRFGDAIRSALQPTLLSPENAPRNGGDLASGGFINSLKQGALVNFSYGIPRIILVSDMSRLLADIPAERAKAKAAALKKAQDADLNFKDAEIYVAGISSSPIARDALEMFFLASHGELVSAGPATAIPTFISPPVHVMRYQGVIQYPDNQFPIRLRLATDQNGTVVNSWISVQATREQFVPIHGIVTCQNNGQCTFAGDDIFAQVWNVNRSQGSDPLFDQSIPFAGARSLSFTESGNGVRGFISDPQLRFQGVQGYKLQFNASRQLKAEF